jgi:hypothetical protein
MLLLLYHFYQIPLGLAVQHLHWYYSNL